MKTRLLLLAAASLLTVAPANADAPAPRWTGCYVGVGLGMASSVHETGLDVGGATLLTIDGLGSSGVAVAGHVGCDLQLQQFVIGAFADYTWHDQTWQASSPLIGGTLASMSIDTQWTVGARAGVVMSNVLVYGLVGYTEVQVGAISVPLAATSFAVPDMSGWVFGGGAEIALGNGLFLAGEYRYAMLDRVVAPITTGVGIGIETEMHTAMARLSYRFGGLPFSN